MSMIVLMRLNSWKIDLAESNILADRTYGAQIIREYISKQGVGYIIFPKSNALHL